MLNSCRSIVVLSCVLLSAVPVAVAQSYRGSVQGTVLDAAGRPVSDIALEVIGEETGERRTATSGPGGEFVVPSLTPGGYRLEVLNPAFQGKARRFDLLIHQQLHLDVILGAASLSQEITVIGRAGVAGIETTALTTVIDGRQISALPLDGRNYLELTLLASGTAPAASGSAASLRGSFSLSSNGAREDANNYLLDGAYNVDPKLNTIALTPPLDGVREFEIQTAGYDASFGRSGGAQIHVALKSGTNHWHGTAYEFLRNQALDARNYFAPAEGGDPPYRRSQFGFSLGGPLSRDRSFIFLDYEGRRISEGVTRISNVPTTAERQGDFSGSLMPPPTDPATGMPFPGGRIPDGRLDPIGLDLAALYPLPNRAIPLQNFVSSPASRDRSDSFDLRLDHGWSKSTTWLLRYSFGDRDLFEPFSGPAQSLVPGYGTRVPRRAQNLLLGETRVLSSSLVHEGRLTYSRVAAGAIQENAGLSINREVGLPETSSRPRDFGLSLITVTGFSPLGDEINNPQHSVTNTFQYSDHTSLVRGRHILKVGGDGRYVQQNAYRDVQARGFLNFSDRAFLSGNGLADLLLGFPALTGVAKLDNPQHLRTWSASVFLQDQYRLSPRSILFLGLRYEFNSPPVDTEDRATIYSPATRSLVRLGSNGVPRGGYRSDRNNWAPRVGLSWSPDRESITVLRAGYGIYHDQSQLAPGEAMYFNPPYYDFNLYFPLPGYPLRVTDPFPQQFPYPLPDSALAFQEDLRTPYIQHWNIGLQQRLGAAGTVEAVYAGSKGTKLISARDINQPRPGSQYPNPRPDPRFDDIDLLESRASSVYHSLQIRHQYRQGKGLTVFSAYTWSKSLDDASNFFASAGDPNFPQDSLNLAAERGRSSYDVRHRVTLSYACDLALGRNTGLLPGRGFWGALFSGWQSFGILSLQSGRPFTAALLPEIDNSNTGRSILGFGANDRPNAVGSPALARPNPERWFNADAFALPQYGTFGNAGRNTIEGPGYADINASLIKNSLLREKVNLQFRFEVFNLFNRPNFDRVDTFWGSPTFGRILSALSPRHIQVGLRLVF